MKKLEEYQALVQKRKQCGCCQDGLENPAKCCNGVYDGDEIGPWSSWQGHLDARLMVVGQDWGDVRYFTVNKGKDAVSNPTNRTLVELLGVTGVHIDPFDSKRVGQECVFLTNAILCLKSGGLQAPVKKSWFENCSREFLWPLIRLVQPRVVVTLGVRAYEAIALGDRRPKGPFRDLVNLPDGITICDGVTLFPRYHCGQRILNTHRKIEQQREDWKRIGQFLNTNE